MSASELLRTFRNDILKWKRSRPGHRPAGGRGRNLTRPLRAEPLEDRTMLTVFVVDTPIDSAAEDGLVSLREAVTAANLNTPFGDAPAGQGGDIVDSITFDDALSGQTFVLGGEQLTISGDLSITGLGSADLTISGNNVSRVFSIDAGVSAKISGVKITDGFAEEELGNYNEGNGGGIYNEGKLTLTNSLVTGNRADLHGGGVYNRDGSVTIKNSEFSSNEAYGKGGAFSSFVDFYGTDAPLDITGSLFKGNQARQGAAIWCDMEATIADSTFSENKASRWGGAIAHRTNTMKITNSSLVDNSSGRYGGAIDIWGGTVILTDSTVSGNSAKWNGGAIENYFAILKLFNSTISGNSADGLGGAIDNWLATVESTNSTIVLNRADADGNGLGAGGGIYNHDGTSPWGTTVALLNNTLLAGNSVGAAGSDSPNDLTGLDVEPASSHNLIGDSATSGGLTHGENGNIVGDGGSGTIDISTVIDTDLADNGGPTLTHALVPNSPAIDAGDDDKAINVDRKRLRYDQRGEGFRRIFGGSVDIGAFEVQPPPQFVEVDVRPSINLASRGLIAVTVFTTDDFDAAGVDVSSVVWADANVAQNNNGSYLSALEDVDGDGDLDLVLHFRLSETDLLDIYEDLLRDDLADDTLDSFRQSVDIVLDGLTNDGVSFVGTDTVDLFLTGKALRDFRNQRGI